MEVLYLSSMCSQSEQDKMFKEYGAVTSFASQRFNRLFVEGLRANNCHVTALTFEYFPVKKAPQRSRFEETEDDVRYIYIPTGTGKVSIIRNAIKEIKKWCKEHKNGLVFCDTIIGELSIALNLSHVHNQTVAIVTDVPLSRANDNRKGIKKIPAIIKQRQIFKFDSYVFLTKQMNADLNNKNKPYVIIEGFAKKDTTESTEKYSKTCIMAGMLENVFGVEFLLKSFLKADVPNSKLIFYGYGSAVPSIEKAHAQDSRIVYGGILSNHDIVLEEKKATILINPRPDIDRWTSYSFPSKNIEYMSSGTPLVAFKLPGIPDEYDPYYFHIEGYDENVFGHQLNALLNMDVETISAMGRKGMEWVLAEKSPVLQVEKCLKAIKNSKE